MALASNPRAVVTGGGGGIGRAFCLALARRGGRILVTDVNLTGAEETAKMVRGAGGKAEVVACDVANKGEVLALPEVMKEKFGGTDLVINNAGVAVGGPVQEIPLGDWEWLMGINLWGVIYGCHAFTPVFQAQKSGHFINVASAAGLLSGPGMAPYNVAKAGVIALSESLSVELGRDGIGVSVLCPTFIKTNIFAASRTHGANTGELGEKMMARAKKSADEIAEVTLAAAERNELYVVPHSDGLWAWRLKRLMPEGFYKRVVPRAFQSIESGDGRNEGPLADLRAMFRKKG